MKIISIIQKIRSFSSLFLILVFTTNNSAQESPYIEYYGRTLNIGIGIGYYGYVGHSMPVIHADYEFGIVKNFTLAPFVSFYSYRNNYYYLGSNNGKNYYYHETVIPVGVKGTYYLDDLLKANSDWDFYLAGSLGAAFAKAYWDNGYSGDKNVYHGAKPLFLDIHMGAECHLNKRIGIFLDLSSGVSTIGMAIH
jgi:hypothetical protein